MLPLDAIALERTRFVAWGIWWLVVSCGWVATSLWVVQDARSVFGRAMPWKLFFTLVGAAIFAGTVLVGLAAFPSLLVLLPVILTATYFLVRDKASPRSLQWLPWDRLKPLEERLIARLGLTERLDRSRLTAAASRHREAAVRSLVLLRHDGSPCDERDPAIDKQLALDIGPLKRLLWRAVDCGSSMMSWEPAAAADTQALLRCRVAGAMESLPFPKRLTTAGAANAIKSLVGLDPAPSNQPRYGGFHLVVEGHKIEMQAAVGPGAAGEKIMVRPFDPAALPTCGRLGMSEPLLRKVREIVMGRQGLLLVAGPPGSGKTTTAFSLLKSIDPLTTTIVTIEDRPQYKLDNIVQTVVDDTPQGTVPKRLEALLRQDPAKILFGEIRDAQTADIALRTAALGKLVITTRRALDAATAIAELLQGGCDLTTLQGSLTAVLSQRLIRLLCPICRKPCPPQEDHARQLGLPQERLGTLFEPQGCEHCLNGFRGTTAIFELLVIDQRLRDALGVRPGADTIRKLAMTAGTRSLWHAAIAHVLSGETSIAEARRVVS